MKYNDLPIYQQRLQENFDLQQTIMNRLGLQWGPLETCYIGGGTPSLWGEQGAKFLTEFLKRNKLEFASREQRECTIEMNPFSVQASDLFIWEDTGVNRYSIGVQSWDDRFLELLNRIHRRDHVHRTLSTLHQRNANFSVDVMLGLPFSQQWKRDVVTELKQLMEYGPKHFSVSILTVNCNYQYHQQLPTEDYSAEEFLRVADFLTGQGFSHYEVSNYAIPGHQSKHNWRYWNGENVAALGPGATGFLGNDKTWIRYRWNGDEEVYREEQLSAEELRLESFYLRLRTNQVITADWCLDVQERESFAHLLALWAQRGMIKQVASDGPGSGDNPAFRMTSAGMLVLDSLMDQLFNAKIL